MCRENWKWALLWVGIGIAVLVSGCDPWYEVPVHVRGLEAGQEAPLKYQVAFRVNESTLPGKPLAEANVYIPRPKYHSAEEAALLAKSTDKKGRVTGGFVVPSGQNGQQSFKVSKPGYRTVTGDFDPRLFRTPPEHEHALIVVMEKKPNDERDEAGRE